MRFMVLVKADQNSEAGVMPSEKDMAEMAQAYKPGGSPQDVMAKQAEFAKKAMEAAIANTRDIAELVQKSTTEAFKIVQDRMKESYEEIRATVEKKK